MNQAIWTYLGQLTRALRLVGVEGRQAGEFVAEIDSHLTESGADPVEEFGSPFELAEEFARRPGVQRPGWVPPLWSLWLLMVLSTMIGVIAIEALITGWVDGQIPIRAMSVLMVVVLMPSSLWFGYMATRRLDGRDWRPVTGMPTALMAAGVGVLAATIGQVVGPGVIATVPATAFWVSAAVVLPLLIAVYRWRNNPIRFPDHAKHLRRLMWTPLLFTKAPARR